LSFFVIHHGLLQRLLSFVVSTEPASALLRGNGTLDTARSAVAAAAR
jgi:hypothetical protein